MFGVRKSSAWAVAVVLILAVAPRGDGANVWPTLNRAMPANGCLPLFGNDQTSDSGEWWTGFGYPGTDGQVNCVVIYGGELIVAGRFSLIGTFPATNIAAWNGTFWHALGAGVEKEIHCMVVWNDQLFVGGYWGGQRR
jgi:hypothetical protein